MERQAALLNVKSGREYILGDVTTIGRLRSCDIAVVHGSVSRYHARIIRSGGDYIIEDLNSRNGTFVDGERIKEPRVLKDGCQIEIGTMVFKFRSRRGGVAGGRDVMRPGLVLIVDETALADGFELKFEAREISPVGKNIPPETREKVIALGARLRNIQSSDALIEELAKQLVENLECADRCIVTMSEGAEGRLIIAADYVPEGREPDEIRIGKGVLDAVLKSGKSGIYAGGDAAKRRAFMCVPIVAPERVVGVVYLSARAGGGFSEEDLKEATALVNEVASYIGALRLYESVRSERDRLRVQNIALLRESEGYSFTRIIGDSPEMKRAIAQARNAATMDCSVLIIGEPGTGRQFFAEIIHFNSKRRAYPFVVTRCYPDDPKRLRLELFGVETKGVKGGPVIRRGAIERANGGTVFIDDIDRMPLDLQNELLDVMEMRRVQRAGSKRAITVDTRIMASSRVPLSELVERGKFSEALLYKLNVVSVRLPSLLERKRDIPLLAQHFLQKFSLEMNKPIRGFEDAAMAFMRIYTWPRNVRELKNLVERLVIKTAPGGVIEADQLPSDMKDLGGSGLTVVGKGRISESAAKLEKQIIEETLKHCNYDKGEAARALGLTTVSLEQKLKRYGIKV